MNGITNDYLNRAELVLLVTLITYFLMNGAQIFETAVLIPKWTSRPPQSLAVLQGAYAPDLKTFWIVIHSIHELTFIAAIGYCWHLTGLRNSLLILFGLHFAVRVWTIGYFAPQIMAFQKADTTLMNDKLLSAVLRWRNLNYVRVACFVALSIWLAFLYTNFFKHKIERFSIETQAKNTQTFKKPA